MGPRASRPQRRQARSSVNKGPASGDRCGRDARGPRNGVHSNNWGPGTFSEANRNLLFASGVYVIEMITTRFRLFLIAIFVLLVPGAVFAQTPNKSKTAPVNQISQTRSELIEATEK